MASYKTAEQYIAALEPDRRAMVSAIRDEIKANLAPGFVEIIDFGMIVYAIPLEYFPDTYNGHPLGYVALASQKQYVSVYLTGVYCDLETEEWFKGEYHKTGKRLNMGKSCVRFRKLEDVPLELLGRTVARETPDSFIEKHHRAHNR